MSNAEYRKRPVWKLKGAENTECGNGKFKLKIYTVFKKCANNFDCLSFMYFIFLYFIHETREMGPSVNPGLSECPGGSTEGKSG